MQTKQTLEIDTGDLIFKTGWQFAVVEANVEIQKTHNGYFHITEQDNSLTENGGINAVAAAHNMQEILIRFCDVKESIIQHHHTGREELKPGTTGKKIMLPPTRIVKTIWFNKLTPSDLFKPRGVMPVMLMPLGKKMELPIGWRTVTINEKE